MKPIIKKENQDTILTSEITVNHIVLGILDKKPALLYLGNYGIQQNGYSFKSISNGLLNENGWSYNDNTITQAVDTGIKNGWEIEVFEEKDWKKALQWLIDNAE